MSSNPNLHKFVALVNKNLEPPNAMNAVAHAFVGLGSSLGGGHLDEIRLLNYRDLDGQSHPNVSALSLIVLRGTSGNLRTLRQDALAAGLPCVDFTTTMTGGSYVEQLERTAQTAEAELEYSVVAVFGATDVLNPLTRKYSLYK